MNLNCRPGDLAISVSTQNTENEGVIVRVVRRHTNTPEWNWGNVPAWWCVSDETLTWRFASTGEVRTGHEGAIPDQALRPIRPREPDESEHTQEVLTA
jgi:hypothetical protein